MRIRGGSATRWGLVTAMAAALLTVGGGVPAVEAPARAADWQSSGPFVTDDTVLAGSFAVPKAGQRQVTARLRITNARVAAIPEGCMPSSVLARISFISADGRRLTCRVSPRTRPRTILFAAVIDGTVGERVSGTVTINGRSKPLDDKLITQDAGAAPADLRLLSSPDFLNADVGDLAHGPGFWRPGRTANSTNAYYQRALNTVLGDWRSLRPDAVLVAGDLVDGWWGTRAERSGNFGPSRTEAQRREALKRAAGTYYPQWAARLRARGLTTHVAMGDHEYGDNPWHAAKRRLAPLFEKEFARRFTRDRDGSPRYADRPRGSRHEHTAYAWRPRPSVQMVTINVFDITRPSARVRLDRIQMRWLERVLRKARADGVKWVIVQGHTPIVGPVRERGSSGLQYERGRDSQLWRLFRKYGVDLYLCGEVHDVTAIHRDGIMQVSHGGLFAFGLTNYLIADVYDDHLQLTLRDYGTRSADRGRRLWETRPAGMPRFLEVARKPFTIGTAILDGEGRLLDRSGIMRPWRSRR